MSSRALAFCTLVLALAFAVSPFLAPEFSGFHAEQFPVPQEDPPMQPAGYAFAIWGVIYLWLIAGMVFGALRRASASSWQPMRAPLCVSLAIGTTWLAVATRSPILATVLIWAMLLSALIALFRTPRSDRRWCAYPLGLYAGWLTAASCVSLGVVIAGYGVLDGPTAAVAVLFAALVLASAVQSTLGRTPTFALAVIWALVAVVVQNLGTSPTVAALAGGGAGALLWPALKAWRTERQNA